MDKTLPPHNVEAEEAELGAMLINPAAVNDVAGFLRPEDFYMVKHGWVYEAILDLQKRGEPVDFLTVTTELDGRGRLTEAGGRMFVSKLMDAVPSAIHAESYGRMIQDAATRRSLLTAASQVAKAAYDESIDIDAVLETAEREVFLVGQRRLSNDLVGIRTAVAEYNKQLLQRAEGGSTGSIATGYPDLDKVIDGLRQSDLVLVAGRPSMGKTSLLLSIALNVAGSGPGTVAIFSLEMSRGQLVERLVSIRSGIDSQKLRNGKLAPSEKERYEDTVRWLESRPIVFDDSSELTPMQMRAKCRRLASEGQLSLVVLDYVQQMKADGRHENHENRVQEFSYISRQLKVLAKELNVPVLVASQLNRAVEQRKDRHPLLSDLRESGTLEQDADIVLLMYRDDYYTKEASLRPNVADIEIAKHRNGPTGLIELYFDKQLTKFSSLAKITPLEGQKVAAPAQNSSDAAVKANAEADVNA